ncbi:MAG: DNA gyrase subunit A [Ezakiella sp.]|uniref:DNA gyrase subunit A n=1 Tax=Ezakiella sp. TaxID=1935205 RepID=UPI00297BA9E5|nr:DNA gyrase subunit A [Ezakiella sp.]MDD7730656.1 DNA gyrase subunit A [Eubacteriales bacterium]MDY6079876.1 DNA gyrase subunit A [Ezakiella sp.]
MKNVIDVKVEKEMKKSYLEYAMSVIVARALPDVRDGLKPVHRRILYSMEELGVTNDKPYRKSARVVGDVLGKYHPHSDTAVYDAMVRLAQDFNTRYLLVDGHGNFGSVDGDGAAAMRYTEVRMTKLTHEMIRDIEKETVDFSPNFDESLKEPDVLPSRFPNLLVNGSSGIAVGMATNLPPHNLSEVIDGLDYMIDNPDCTLEDLMQFIKGPDFPTGATIMGKGGIKDAYSTGRGLITLRAKAEIETTSRGRNRIVVKEIPYQVNKSKLIQKIAELVRNKEIDGITDIRDESDRQGMRIVIELRKDANPKVTLNLLYKRTQMQTTFGVINLALVDGEPKTLTLKELMYYYLEHQKEIVTRRTIFDLKKAEARAHIVEGLLKALDYIDEIIKLIRASKDDAEARSGLMSKFEFTEIQANAILSMQLRRLTGLEKDKLTAEYEDLIKRINRFNEILSSERILLGIIKDELNEIKEKYGDERRTDIVLNEGEIDVLNLIADESVVITITDRGYIKRVNENTYKAQKRGGKGVKGLTTNVEDVVDDLYTLTTHDEVYFFTNLGKVYSLRAYEIPESGRTAKGTAIVNLLQISGGEKITQIIPIKKNEEREFMTFVTKNGIIKKTELAQYENIRQSGLIAINLDEDDDLISVYLTNEEDEIISTTRKGKAIRINGKDVRPTGRSTRGVKLITLEDGDSVVSSQVVGKGAKLLTITEKGYGKMTSEEEYTTQSRGGKGILTHRINEKTGALVTALVVYDEKDLLLISSSGVIIRISAKEIAKSSRATIGVKLMDIGEEKIVSAIQTDETEE